MFGLFGNSAVAKNIAKADAARDRADWKTAAKHYELALKKAPKICNVWIQLGHARREAGDTGGALTAYRRAIETEPTSSEAHLQLGNGLKLTQRREEAEKSYRRAIELDPNNLWARSELNRLGLETGSAPHIYATQGLEEAPVAAYLAKPPSVAASDSPVLALDVSDLVQYFEGARSPTGIQRVQINVSLCFLSHARSDYSPIFVTYSEAVDFWTEIDAQTFGQICRAALAGSLVDDPAWKKARAELKLAVTNGAPIAFPRGTILLNIGTSWWLPDYFLKVRAAKARYGIHYVPFVHDCIPILLPEYCVKGLTQQFIGWALGVFGHADGYLVNSRATRDDLAQLASFVGTPIAPPKVVTLDGRFFEPTGSGAGDQALGVLRKRGLGDRPFVLFVGTLEIRKNHMMAFNVWERLVKKRGLEATPTLICVGRRGWMFEPTQERLDASDVLKKSVVLLTDIADPELAALYDRCLFTIYPSFYEGWGLPVTEALSFGKTALASNCSSLPEAGGEFSDYFDLESEVDFAAKVERLIDDGAYRKAKEDKIHESFRAREWPEIADDIASAALTFRGAPDAPPAPGADIGVWPTPAAPGVLHRFADNTETFIWPGMQIGEVFRVGAGWNKCDDWGCWMKGPSAEIAFRVDESEDGSDLFLYLGLSGLPYGGPEAHVMVETVGGSDMLARFDVRPGETVDKVIRVPAGALRGGVAHVRIVSTAVDTLGRATGGKDRRAATLGVRGFFYCRESDYVNRLKILEAAQFGSIEVLAPRAPGSVSAPARRALRSGLR